MNSNALIRMLAILVIVGFICFYANADKAIILTETLNKILISNVKNQLKTIESSLVGQLKAVEETVSLMQVSCTGKVTQLKVPCINCSEKRDVGFYATFSKDIENVDYNATVIFDKVLVNKGGAYNHTAGVFTVPRDGLYIFHCTILTKPGSWFHTLLHVNGHTKSYNRALGNSGSQMYVGDLKKGDMVKIVGRFDQGRYAYADWSSFSGFML